MHLETDERVNQVTVGFIAGDGVGPEVMRAAQRVVNRTLELVSDGREVHWEELLVGQKARDLTGEYLPNRALYAMEELRLVLKGPLSTPVGEGIRSLTVQMRKALDLYACIRPIRYFPGVPSPVKHPEQIDMVVFRENTEDVYAGIEWETGSTQARELSAYLRDLGVSVPDDAALGVKVMTPKGSERLIRAALLYALGEGRRSVTMMHKGNIMKHTEGGFRRWGYELAAREFGGAVVLEGQEPSDHAGLRQVVLKDRIADNLFQQVLTHPGEFDVIAAPNLNGDYLSDALAAQVGGLGMAPGANVSERVAVFEATHGSAPKYAGQDRMNPCSLILSAAMLFRHIGWSDIATVVEAGIVQAIAKGNVTYDLARGNDRATVTSTTGFATAIIEGIQESFVSFEFSQGGR